MTNRTGFTLAEVLITLGIIGVVAAMTMPTLINQTNGAQYKAAYKKALSALSQAVTLNVALDDYNFADVTAGTGTGNTDQTVVRILNDRMNVVNSGTVSEKYGYITTATGGTANSTMKEAVGDAWYGISFADGITFFFDSAAAASCNSGTTTDDDDVTTTNKCYGVIDVNGSKAPNKYVTCDDSAANIMDEATDERSDDDKAKACEIKSPTDIYPVFFYDQTIVPASAAAKAVLYGK